MTYESQLSTSRGKAELAIIAVSTQHGPVVLLVVAIHTKVLYEGAVDPFCLTVG